MSESGRDEGSGGVSGMIEELRSETGPGRETRAFNDALIAGFRSRRDQDRDPPPEVVLLTTTGPGPDVVV